MDLGPKKPVKSEKQRRALENSPLAKMLSGKPMEIKADLLNNVPAEGIARISVKDLVTTEQIRKNMDPEDIQLLAESLKKVGMLNPITVKPIGDGKYQVIAGHRRLEAAKLLGWQTVPCIVVSEAKNEFFIQFTENIHRKDLTPMEVAEVIGRYAATMMKRITDAASDSSENQESGPPGDQVQIIDEQWISQFRNSLLRSMFWLKNDRMTEEEREVLLKVMDEFKVSRRAVSVSLFLYTLPQYVKERLARFDLTQKHYRVMMERVINDPDDVLSVAEEASRKGLSSSQLDAVLRLKKEAEKGSRRSTAGVQRVYEQLKKFESRLVRNRYVKEIPEVREQVKSRLMEMIRKLEEMESGSSHG